MYRALAALTVAAFATLAIDVSGRGDVRALLPGAAFLLVATLGFGWVRRRGVTSRYAYVLVLLILGYAVFGLSEVSVGAILLLVVLVSQAVLLLPTPAVVAVVAIVPLFHAGMPFTDGLREGTGLLAVAVFAAVLTTLVLREQRARAALAEAQERLRRLAATEERNRVARDIHDGLGHALTVVQMQIKAGRAVLAADPGRADEVFGKAQEQAEEALREVRRSVGALREPRPAVPLPEALRALADQSSAAGVPTAVDVTGAVRPVSAAAEESLFRAAQEGLTNVRRHAGAARAELRLDFTGPSCVRLEVRDDGIGAAPGGGGFGLVGVRERAALAGGRMELDSLPGGGSTLWVEVPG